MVQILYTCLKKGLFNYECNEVNVSFHRINEQLRNHVQFMCHYHNKCFTVKYSGRLKKNAYVHNVKKLRIPSIALNFVFQ
jgi:hypothetical protein